MMAPERIFKLSNGPGSLGLSCDEGGVTLAGVSLLLRGDGGFQPRPEKELSKLLADAYGLAPDGDRLSAGLEGVARALNRGNTAQAMIAAVLLRLPDLDWDGAVRIAKSDEALSKYSEDQPRDWRGRWTASGSEGSTAGNDNGFDPNDLHPVQEELIPFLGDDLTIGGELPWWIRTLPDSVKGLPREPIPRLSGKEQSSDIPSWAERLGVRPRIDEDGQRFAERVMNDTMGQGKLAWCKTAYARVQSVAEIWEPRFPDTSKHR